MPAQQFVTQRKIPRQARAHATVEAILTAAAQVLVRGGLDDLTTARVAERAGVSIGSLYQYFPNKQALAAAVVDDCTERFLREFADAIASRSNRTLHEAAETILHAAFVAHPHSPDLHRMLIELTPRVDRAEMSAQTARAVSEIIAGVLAPHRSEIDPSIDLPEAAMLIETLLETVCHRAVQDHPVHLEANVLRHHSRKMIVAYLTAPEV